MGLFDLFKSKNSDVRRGYIKELIRVAKADGHLEKSEHQFILRIAQRLEYSQQEVIDLSKEVEQEQTGEVNRSKERRLKLLFDTVGIMMIDGNIDPKEMALCHSIAMKSGFEHRVVDDIVYRIHKLTDEGKSIEEASEKVYQRFRDA